MTSRQESIGRTEIVIHNVPFPNFDESETQISPISSSLKLSDNVQSTIVHQKNSASSLFHILKEFHDRSTVALDKGGKTIITNRESPCISGALYILTGTMHKKHGILPWLANTTRNPPQDVKILD